MKFLLLQLVLRKKVYEKMNNSVFRAVFSKEDLGLLTEK